MIPYILHVTIVIAVCFIFYKLLLQKETFFRLNRLTLLICLLVSFGLPLIPVPAQWSWSNSYNVAARLLNPNGSQQVGGTSTISDGTATAPAGSSTAPVETPGAVAGTSAAPANDQSAGKKADPPAKPKTTANTPGTPSDPSRTAVGKVATSPSQGSPGAGPAATQTSVNTAAAPESNPILSRILEWMYYIYIFGVVVFLVNLIFQISILLYQAYGSSVIRDGKFRIIEVTGDQAPCSFGNNIFINPAKYDWETYNQILLHEKIHISQRHTLDILAAEIVLALQWFNPFAWLYRKEVENNLEFLTDQSLLRQNDVERSSYQMNLLKVSAPHLPLGITTNYNQSLLKRRIVMMNSKSSSIHTIWKYFFLLPLLTCLVCALNKPVLFGQSNYSAGKSVNNANHPYHHVTSPNNNNEGTWYVTTKGDQFHFDFKDERDDRAWRSSTDIRKSDFDPLPSMGKCAFKLVREAGTVTFTGEFDGEQGFGHYTFKPDESFFAALVAQGIEDPNDNERFAFFLVGITKDYVAMIRSNGFPDVSKNNLIAMAALGIDQPYIQSWKTMGVSDISENNIIAAKALHVDSAYVNDLHRAGYRDLDIQQLIAFKSQGINGDYVRAIGRNMPVSGRDHQARKDIDIDQDNNDATSSDPGKAAASPGKATPTPVPVPAPVITPASTPTPMSESVTVVIGPDSNPPVRASGKHVHIHTAAKAQSSSSGQGYSNSYSYSYNSDTDGGLPSPEDLIAYKSLNIDSAYLKSLKEAGLTHLSYGDVTAMKSLNVTPEFISSFKALGYKDIPTQSLIAMKSLNITPDYVRSIHAMGFKDVSLEQLPALKSLNITAAYIKSFKDIGYDDISLEELPALKSMNITPQYILEFRKIGYKFIPLSQLPALKSLNITPQYVLRMKEKGFDSKDLNKYIQLKTTFE